uniref:M14 family metallopeptidase n=1 Tax=Salmonella sp. s51884 TaxID=3159654 RepID=UPI003980E06F
VALLCSAKKSYDGYKVYQYVPRVAADKVKLDTLFSQLSSTLDIWHEPKTFGDNADIMVAPVYQQLVEEFFTERNMKFSVIVEDVGATMKEPSTSFYSPGVLSTFDYDIYHSEVEISNWADDFAAAHPNFVEKVVMGTSYELRDIVGLKFSTGPNRPIFFQGGIHAREWISPATMINLARKFAEEYEGGNPDVVNILENYDVYILPVLNADGYSYSFTDDRMWRKNRNPNGGARCKGVDLNRNYDYQWGGDGANGIKCDGVYYGTGPLSEPETSSTDAFYHAMSDLFGGPVAFIDFHSYGQFWMWPWGYEVGLPDTNDRVAQEAAAVDATVALKAVSNTKYTLQNSGEMYAAAGAGEDYGYGSLHAKYSYCVELRPSNANVGFELPENEIYGTGEETFAGVIGLLKYIFNNDRNAIANP